MGTRLEDIVGQKFGLLTAERVDHISPEGHAYWRCKCDCGAMKIVRASHLRAGNVKSCGCAQPRKTHGWSKTRLYQIWNNMKQRCSNSGRTEYSRYGGRGIEVCAEWMNSFEAFRDWALHNGYTDELSIDRKDSNGNYTPDNCRWATAVQQANNTRKTRFLTYNGETHSVSEWAKILGINQSTLNMRLNKYNWSTEEALGKETKKYVSQ